MFKLINKYYLQKIEPHKNGGVEICTTSKRAWVGLGICFLLGFVLEITYLIVPAPLDFLIEHFPWLAILIFFGLLIHLVVLPYFEIYNSYFEMAPGKLVAIQGLFLAFKREDQFIPYNLIRGCRIEQNICGRIFDYGDLLIGTSMTSGVELTLPNIDHPQQVMKEIEGMLSNKYQYVDFTRAGS